MHYLLSFLFIAVVSIAHAQNDTPFLFKQEQDLQLVIGNKKDLQLAFSPLKGTVLEVVEVKLMLKGKEIILSTPTFTKEKEESYRTATFPLPLFDVALEGHLEWGKAILEQLDSQQVDSVVRVVAHLTLAEDSIGVGELPISFKGGWSKREEFWNRAAQYKLLQQQVWVHDSLKYWKKEVLRTESLLQINQIALQKTQTALDNTQKKIAQACQDTLLVDSLLQVETALHEGLEKARNGQAITDPEKMQLAQQTTQRSQLLLQINSHKNGDCQASLEQLLQQRRNLNNITRQRKLLLQQLSQKKKQGAAFKKLQEKTTQELAVINARLPK